MKIAINGFGRIGRTFLRSAFKDLEIVAINDLGDLKTLEHLLKYDSTYGEFTGKIESGEDEIIIDGKKIKYLSEKNPENLPWRELGVDIVIESTGVFTGYEEASKHIQTGAKYAIISAPTKDASIKTIVLGVNEETFDPQSDQVISMASCTTNALTPVADVLHKTFGIEKALMSTIHSFTMDQVLQDAPHKDLRRARSALQSIIPTTTGATRATAEVIPDLKGKIDGLSFRVPTPTVSVIDFVAVLKNEVTIEEINKAFQDAANVPRYQGALAVTDEPLVSVDFRGNPNASIVDLLSTQVVGGNLVKVIAWYDNELGYSNRLKEFCKYIQEKSEAQNPKSETI